MEKKIIAFKQHFFKYINKAEYAMALSAVAGSFCTTIIQSYSSYLSDRNARIERINKTPLNYIYVDYISYEMYEQIIDKRNWKSSAERDKIEQMTIKNNEQKTKKQEFLDSVNGWLKGKIAKKQQNNSEIDEESLRQLAILNNRAVEEYTKNQQKQETINLENQENNTDKLIKKSVLPPDRKKVKKDINYFVIQYDDSVRYDPKQYRENHKTQNITTEQNKKVVGFIAGQKIKKDKNIFESFLNVFKAMLFKKNKYNKKGTVVHTKYDQDGQRIHISETEKENRIKEKRNDFNNKKYNDVKTSPSEIEEQRYQSGIAEIENSNLEAKKQKQQQIFKPVFTIDGNLQKMNEYNDFQKLVNSNNVGLDDVQMLSYLEYTIEKCWYQKYNKKYKYNTIASSFLITYNNDGNLDKIQLKRIDEDIDKNSRKTFINDVVNMFKSCDISKTKYLTANNYNLWQEIVVNFA